MFQTTLLYSSIIINDYFHFLRTHNQGSKYFSPLTTPCLTHLPSSWNFWSDCLVEYLSRYFLHILYVGDTLVLPVLKYCSFTLMGERYFGWWKNSSVARFVFQLVVNFIPVYRASYEKSHSSLVFFSLRQLLCCVFKLICHFLCFQTCKILIAQA